MVQTENYASHPTYNGHSGPTVVDGILFGGYFCGEMLRGPPALDADHVQDGEHSCGWHCPDWSPIAVILQEYPRSPTPSLPCQPTFPTRRATPGRCVL